MAKTDPKPTDDTAAPQAPAPTPDNTPIPGGGRWRWDDTLPGWVSLDTPAADVAN